jgi:hypothetical protein
LHIVFHQELGKFQGKSPVEYGDKVVTLPQLNLNLRI